MLEVLLISLITSSSAFTTHRYDVYGNFGNYHPSAPLSDKVFWYENSNERHPVQVYEYAKRYDGVVISDVFQGPLFNSDGDRRRVDMPYSYQNPYQWNRQVPWNRVSVTESAKFNNRFENSKQDSYNLDTRNTQPVVQQDEEEVINQSKQTTEFNKTKGNASLPQISTQLDDVNRTLVINEQQITWSKNHRGLSEDNANIITRSINSVNNTNSLNTPIKQNVDNINLSTKTNNKTANNNNRHNNTANASNKYNTKTTQDNEVTPRNYEQRTKAYDDDRWIWSNGEGQVTTTTIQTDLGDRAAFSGDACPVGKVKVGNTCVLID